MLFNLIRVVSRSKKNGLAVHFGVEFSSVEVYDYTFEDGFRRVTRRQFADGEPVTVVREIAWKQAPLVRARLNELMRNPRRYDLLSWNCETFAEWLTSGTPEKRSGKWSSIRGRNDGRLRPSDKALSRSYVGSLKPIYTRARAQAEIVSPARRCWGFPGRRDAVVGHPFRGGVHNAGAVQDLDRSSAAAGEGVCADARSGGLGDAERSRAELEDRHVGVNAGELEANGS